MQEFDILEKPFDLKFVIDFEKTKTMSVLYKPQYEPGYVKVFEISNIIHYINQNQNFFSMMTHLGKKHTFIVILRDVSVFEKKHKLDVEETLAVSNNLSQEIFSKINDFTLILNSNKDQLSSIYQNYLNTSQKAARFQTLVVDLFRGSKKFEEGVLESLTNLKSINPDNLPRMIRVRNYFMTLKEKQARLFDRFQQAKDFGKLKNVIRLMRSSFKKIDKAVEQITDLISSQEFQIFFKKTDSLIEVLNQMSFQEDLVKVV